MGKVKTISNLKDRVSVQFGFEPGPQDGGFRDIHSTLLKKTERVFRFFSGSTRA